MTAAGRIRHEVLGSLPARYRPLEGWSGPRRRDWSWQFDAVGGGTRLLIKVPRWAGVETLDDAVAAGPQPDTQGEFAALSAMAAAVAGSGDRRLAAVQPVVYVPGVNAVVLEWLDAIPLAARLGWTVPAATAGSLLGRTGAWLRVCHDAIGAWVLEPFDGRAAAAAWRGAVDSLPGSPSGIAQAAERVAVAARRLDGHPVQVGTIHGDFSLRNVLVTGDGRVAVIDPNRYRGGAMADPARLAAELVLGRARLLTGGLLPGSARVRRWVGAFMEGYGRHDESVFAYEWAAASLRRWLDLEAGMTGARRVVLAADRHLFKSEIGRLAA